ncbi:MAG: surface carbohydrate biosynthesis protein [Halarcobacter ebronensis]
MVSNFGTVNITDSDISKESRYRVKYDIFLNQGLLPDEHSKKDFDKRFEHYEYIFQSFLNFAIEVGKNHKDINIVVRPHPAEDQKIWRNLADKYNNINVVYEGNLTEWIKASSLVIQNGCTSAMESLILQKSCISYRPKVDEKYDQLLPSKLSVNVFEKNILIEKIKFVLNGGNLITKEENKSFYRVFNENISYYQSDESIQKIIEEIEKVDIKPMKFTIIRKFLIRLLKVRRKVTLNMKLLFASNILKIFNFIGHRSLYVEKTQERVKKYNRARPTKNPKTANLTEDDFVEIFKSYDSIYNARENVKIASLRDGCFIIERIKGVK